MAETDEVRLLTPAFVALTLSDLAYFTAGGILLAVTPLFVVGPLGGGAGAVGLAMGAFSVSTLLLRPWAGRWTDRHGRRRLLVGGAALFACVTLGYLVVDGVAGLIALRLLLGVAEATYFVAGFAALADLAPPQRAGEALSLNSLALYAGTALGPLLGQTLLHWGGFQVAWIGSVVLAASAAAIALRVPETHPPGDEVGPPAPLIHRAALLPGAALFCGVAAMAGFLAFAVLRAQALGIEKWSLVLLLFGATVIVCRLVFARLPDRVGARRVAAAALAVVGIGLILVATAGSPVGLLLGTFVLGTGIAFVTPAVFASIFSVVPAEQRGSAAATTSVFLDLGLGGGPMVVGVLAAATTIPDALLLVAALPLMGSVVMGLLARRTVEVATAA